MYNIKVRQAKESDAELFLGLMEALDTETQFMLFEPGERKATIENQKNRLAKAYCSEFEHILVLDDVDKQLLAGFCAGFRNSNFRDKHVLRIVIGIRQSYAGNQWGFRLLSELEKWAQRQNIRRLELNVMVTNARAKALYEKLGYGNEGTKKDSVFLNSGYVDEYIMAKLI